MRRIMLSIATLLASVSISAAAQPNMTTAIDELRKARQELEAAADNKGGHRQKAIEHVDKAIEQVQRGMESARDD